MKKFETQVQYLKYRVLREVAYEAWNNTLTEHVFDIPKRIVPGKQPTMRCCVYKERAILADRVKIAMGGDKSNPNVIEVIETACDECPMGGYEVTNSCRGCLAHRCAEACPRDAISFDHRHAAHIDKTKCIDCGACARVCPYTAIIDRERPCQTACKIKAISMNESHAALIDNDKCTACGACVYQCPFGAIMDKSYMLDCIEMLKESLNTPEHKVYALVAPSIAGQFEFAKPGQMFTGLLKLGFQGVVEAALGADMVAYKEAEELYEKGFLMSSCCPAFVDYVKKNFPELADSISENLSPMATIAKHIKGINPLCKIVFIGPCTAKKTEVHLETVKPYVDCCITFEELMALLGSRDIELEELEETELKNASPFGRCFAKSGGVAAAVGQALKERGHEDFDYKPISCNGIAECRVALLKKSKNVLPNNFIEGMACVGGCVGGACCLIHSDKTRLGVERHGSEVKDKTITAAVNAADDAI